MKPQTIMWIDGKFTAPVGDDEDMSHDAACAHALMLALLDCTDKIYSSHARKLIEKRADSILREWGFDSGEQAE